MSDSFDTVLRGTKRKRSRQGRWLLAHRDEVIRDLTERIASGTFTVKDYREREIVEGGKLRKIQVLSMYDRIGVHAVMNVVDRHMRKRFILFQGKLEEVSIRMERGLWCLSVQAFSYTKDWERVEKSRSFHEVSRIDYLKRRIVEQVRTKGEFYRIKTFIDIISNPILESMENLLEQSQINSVQGRTILAKKRQLGDWKNVFYRDGRAQIKSLIVKIKSELNGEIAAFAEDHFDDKNADKAWNKLLKSRKVEVRCQELLEDLEAKSNDKLKEISREITNELKFATSFEGDKSLRMHKIIDGKKLWDWSSIALGGGLSIAAGIAYLVGAAAAGPLGWAALAVSVVGIGGSFLFKSRDKKEFEARTRLEKKLRENVAQICDTLEKQMNKNLDSLVSVRIEGLMTEMDKINSVIFRLADTQKELAWGLNNHLLELNNQILTEAIRLIGAEGLQYHVQSVARIPGNTSLILLNDGTVFPKEQKEDLYKLIAERIGFIYDSDNKRVLISRVLGRDIDRNLINIEDKIGVAHIPLGDATPNMKNRVRLAQQFSRLLIMNE